MNINDITKLVGNPNLQDILKFDSYLDHHFEISSDQDDFYSERDDEYIGLNSKALLTSYIDYYQVLSDIPRGETLLDLGSGLSRGTLLATKLKLCRCISIESYFPRVQMAKNALKKINGILEDIQHENLLNIKIPKVYGYYLYFQKMKL